MILFITVEFMDVQISTMLTHLLKQGLHSADALTDYVFDFKSEITIKIVFVTFLLYTGRDKVMASFMSSRNINLTCL